MTWLLAGLGLVLLACAIGVALDGAADGPLFACMAMSGTCLLIAALYCWVTAHEAQSHRRIWRAALHSARLASAPASELAVSGNDADLSVSERTQSGVRGRRARRAAA